MECYTGTMLDVFERSVQDPCSLDLDEQDEIYGPEEFEADIQDSTISSAPHAYIADERFMAPNVSFTNVALDPLQEEDPLASCVEEEEEGDDEEEDDDEGHKDKKSKVLRGRKPSIASSTSSYVSDVSSQSTKLRSPVRQEQKFKNPFKTPSSPTTSPTTSSAYKLRRTMTDPDFPLRPSVLSRRNTSTIIQQMSNTNINNNGRSLSMQGKTRTPSLKRASNSSIGASNRNNSNFLQRSNSTSFIAGNPIIEDPPTPRLESPNSRSYSRCGSIGIPTHLYSLEKYVSSQLDALATKDYEQDDERPASRQQRSNTVAGLINTINGENDKLRTAEFPGLSRCSSARKKSYIEMSLENSFSQ